MGKKPITLGKSNVTPVRPSAAQDDFIEAEMAAIQAERPQPVNDVNQDRGDPYGGRDEIQDSQQYNQ